MVDYLKDHSGQSSLAVARRIGMIEYTMRNIKAGKSQASIEDVKKLLSHFPELSDLAAQHGLTPSASVPKETPYTKPVLQEPPPIYHRMPDSIAATLLRIENKIDEILAQQKHYQDTIQKLIEIVGRKV